MAQMPLFPDKAAPVTRRVEPGQTYTGLPVHGYKAEQPDWAIELVNENKVLEEKVLRQIDAHVRNHDSRHIDQRMVALSRTKVQEAFMWLNRSIFQPGRVRLPEDN